jgi:hypothetical protein
LSKGRKKEGKNKTGRRQEEDRKFKEVMVIASKKISSLKV